MNARKTMFLNTALVLGLCALSQSANAQPTNRGGRQGPAVSSPEVSADGRITFRLHAPNADKVRLSAGDLPSKGLKPEMTRGTNGVWELTVGPFDPGAYRYSFNLDGVNVVDPRNPRTSESLNNVSSLVYVPGSEVMDTKDVPHGAVASVTYYSTTLKKFRRMHVYTPPGYESGKGKYPVFYLLHGAGDCDEAWTSVGRAGFILDNLLAAHKAKPMVVVMPAGHTRSDFGFGARGAGTNGPPVDEFGADFLTDVMPYIEQHYRLRSGRENRAIAGLSMGGSQTLNVAIPHLDKFSYVGVFSSGLLGFGGGRGRTNSVSAGTNAAPAAARGGFDSTWEERHRTELDDAKLKKGLALLWFSTGKDDFLVNNTKSTVEMFKKHGFNPVYEESSGGHTWINWRNYLIEFAPKLFH